MGRSYFISLHPLLLENIGSFKGFLAPELKVDWDRYGYGLDGMEISVWGDLRC